MFSAGKRSESSSSPLVTACTSSRSPSVLRPSSSSLSRHLPTRSRKRSSCVSVCVSPPRAKKCTLMRTMWKMSSSSWSSTSRFSRTSTCSVTRSICLFLAILSTSWTCLSSFPRISWTSSTSSWRTPTSPLVRSRAARNCRCLLTMSPLRRRRRARTRVVSSSRPLPIGPSRSRTC